MAPSPIKHQLTSDISEELPDSPVIKTLPLKTMHLKQTDSTETNESPATKASPPEVVDITRLQEHELSPVVEYGGNLSHSHQARVGVSPTEMNLRGKSQDDEEEIVETPVQEQQLGYENNAFAGTDEIDSPEMKVNRQDTSSPYEVNRSELTSDREQSTVEVKTNEFMTKNISLPLESSNIVIQSPESDLTPVRATTIAHTIVEKVIEEAKIKSAESTPAHVMKVESKDYEQVSTSAPSLEEAQALAQDIVQNVIEEVKHKFAGGDFASDASVASTLSPQQENQQQQQHQQVQLRSQRKKDSVTITRTEASGDGDVTGDEVNYYSDGRSPAYSRPTSGELDINLFASGSGGAGSSQGAGSSEYETCVTSQSTTFKSAVTSQDTSYATARSSLNSQQSSSRSTLIEDSESSGHLGEMSSEASETIITDQDRDLNTPMAEDLDDEISDPTAFMVSIHKTHGNMSIPQTLVLDEPLSPVVSSSMTTAVSSRTADDAAATGEKIERKDSSSGQVSQQQSVTSPGQGSVASIDLASGASLPSYSSVR